MAKAKVDAPVNPILARARQHFDNQEVKIIEVPEWPDDADKPTLIYAKPFTVGDQQILYRKAKGDFLAPVNVVQTILLKALDADGNKMFTIKDEISLRTGVDPEVLARIAQEIATDPNIEDLEKNSETIQPEE